MFADDCGRVKIGIKYFTGLRSCGYVLNERIICRISECSFEFAGIIANFIAKCNTFGGIMYVV